MFPNSDGDAGGQELKSDKLHSSETSASFHGSGVSKKVVDRSSGQIGQLLPGSDLTSSIDDIDEEDDDDGKSSTYSDGPVMSDTYSINLLEYHHKNVSDNSSASGSKNKRLVYPQELCHQEGFLEDEI